MKVDTQFIGHLAKSVSLAFLLMLAAAPLARGQDTNMPAVAAGAATNSQSKTTPPSSNSIAFQETKARAEKGDAAAQDELARMYWKGNGVPKDEAEAEKWGHKAEESWRKQAEQGDAEAEYHVGDALYSSFFFGDKKEEWEKNNAEAVKWFHKAAEQGYAAAQKQLGEAYYYGAGVATNFAGAVNWYRKAAEHGNADAESSLGNMYDAGQGVDKNEAEAVRWWLKAAEQGDSLAAEFLGDAYSSGEGVATNFVEAVKWYGKATNAFSRNHLTKRLVFCYDGLGDSYFRGEGVTKDLAEAVKWYRKAAEQGDRDTQQWLGACYAEGWGVPKDDVEARKWSLKAADQYRKSAERGDADAQFTLAECYGNMHDYAQSVKWYRRAAEQGNIVAQYNLATDYSRGEGAPKNDIEAYKWFSLAAVHGFDDSAEQRDLLAQSMSREEVVEGQRLAAAFVARKESPEDANNSNLPAQPHFADTEPKASGTGFFVSEDGYLLTAFHVVEDAARISVRTKAGTFPATLVKADKANDVALLKVTGKFSALPVGSSRGVKLGESVFTIGFPNIELQGFAPKLTKGEINSLAGMQDDPREFQISVAVQPGNSGGPLVDELGNVVGIVEARLADVSTLESTGALPQNVNYAMKGSVLNVLLDSLPELSAKLKEPNPNKDRKFEDVEKETESAVVLVLVY